LKPASWQIYKKLMCNKSSNILNINFNKVSRINYGTIFAPLNRLSNQLILMIGKFFRYCAEDRLDRNSTFDSIKSMIDSIKFDD
jgi:hypothetical protein